MAPLPLSAASVFAGAAIGSAARADSSAWLAAAVLLSAVIVALAQQTLP